MMKCYKAKREESSRIGVRLFHFIVLVAATPISYLAGDRVMSASILSAGQGLSMGTCLLFSSTSRQEVGIISIINPYY